MRAWNLKKKSENLLSALLYFGAIILALLLIAAVSGFTYGCFTLDRTAEELPEWLTIDSISKILYIPVALAFLLLFMRRTRERTEFVCALHVEDVRWLLYTFLFGILVMMAEYAMLTNISADYYDVTLNDTFEEILEDILTIECFLRFICVCLLGPAVEELLCRLFFPAHFRQAFSAGVAVLLSTFIFAFLHFSNSIWFIVMYTIDSILLFLIFSRTGSIWCAITMHSGLNCYTLLVKYVEFDYANVSIPFLVVTVCTVLAIVAALVRKPNLLKIESRNKGEDYAETI